MTILPSSRARIRWDEEHAQAWIDESFTWTSRGTYLAWVAEWKAELKLRIKEIRNLKAIRRDQTKTREARNGANWHRQALRIECANLFLLRQMAKQRSAQERQQRLMLTD